MKKIKFNLQTSPAIGFIVFTALTVLENITRESFGFTGMGVLVIALWVYIYDSRVSIEREMDKSHMIFERVMLLFIILCGSVLTYQNPYSFFLFPVYVVAFGYFLYEIYIIKMNKENKATTVVKQIKKWFNR